MTAWKAAGLSIQRSSQMQYNTTTHVAFSQLRKGDLIFYGTNRDPSKIYHVAIYIGGGMVAEATSPGKVSQIRAYDASWRIDDLIPVAGRP
uniref:NLPC_P60 n=1 Tax=uncultured Catenulispora sp. TaxID=487357 RepID=A0A060C7C1_9ACTN|nr:NLPC_P60 [uncultured Catenulispora sp.]